MDNWYLFIIFGRLQDRFAPRKHDPPTRIHLEIFAAFNVELLFLLSSRDDFEDVLQHTVPEKKLQLFPMLSD